MTFIKKKFKELVDYKSGYTWSKDQELNTFEPNAIRVLTVSNIQNELDLSSVLYLKNVAEKDRLNKTASKNWSIAVSSNGNRKRIGNAVFIDKDTEYLYASFLTGFIPKENSGLLPEYFFRWFSSYEVQSKISEVAEGTTELRNMSLRHLRNSFIEFPENPTEQRTIANILSKVDEAIAATKSSIAKAERLKKSLMQNLLTGKLKPDGTWRKDDEFFKDEKFGNVPVGWQVDLFGKRVKVQYGKSQKDIVSEDGTIPIYGTGGIIEYGTKALCSNKSILIGRKGTIDKPYFIDTPFWAVDTTYYVESFNDGDMKFLYYSLQRKNLKSLNEATGVPSLTRRTLNRQILLFPPLNEQIEIVKKIEAIEMIESSKQTKIKKLERLKKALMQNLLTGKVRVKINETVNG